MSYNSKVKEFQNRESYSRRVAKGSCNRITVPMLCNDHIKTTVVQFKEVAKTFEHALADKSMSQFQRVNYCKYVLYQLHRNLIETADEGYLPIKGLDFRGCR
jgi:hypothetical protein|tara:strand:- start:65 stop:370 length:306 start_codon:yes stop_codon:yes gene_type:complete